MSLWTDGRTMTGTCTPRRVDQPAAPNLEWRIGRRMAMVHQPVITPESRGQRSR